MNATYYFLPAALAVALMLLSKMPAPGPEVLLNASIVLSAPLLITVAAGSGPAPPHYRFAASSLGGPVFRRLIPRVERLVRSAMVFRESEDVAARLSLYLVGGGLTAACVSAAAALSGAPMAALAAAPALLPLVEVLSLSSRAGSRREWTESELPFFTTLAVALISAGMSFYYVLKRAGELPHLFRQIRKESLLVVRNVEVVGMGVLEAMESAARDHPSQLYRSLIYTVTGVTRTGGSVRAAVVDRGREAMAAMRMKWEAFASRMRGLGEMSVIVFMLLPLSLSVAGIAFAGVAYQGLLVMNLLVLPVLGLMFIVIVLGSVPKVYDLYQPPKALMPMALAAAAGTGVATYFVATSVGAKALPIAFAAAAAAGSIVVWLVMRGQIDEVRSANAQVPMLLREIVEARKSGMEFHEAIREAALSGRYTGAFGRALRRVAARLMMFTASEASSDLRSWSARMAFHMVHEIEASGGGSPVLLEGTIEALSAYEMNRRNGAAAARLHVFMAYMFPAIALIATSMILAIAGQLTSFSQAQQQVSFATPEELERVVEMAWLSVAESSVMLMIAISRAMDLHFYNLWRVAAVCAALIAMVLIQPAVMYQVGSFLMPSTSVGGLR